jgi:hypothetical protein
MDKGDGHRFDGPMTMKWQTTKPAAVRKASVGLNGEEK